MGDVSFPSLFFLFSPVSIPLAFVRGKRAEDGESDTQPSVGSEEAGTPVAPAEEEALVTESSAAEAGVAEATTESPESITETVMDAVTEATTKGHSFTDGEGHWKSQLDLVEWLQGPVIIISIIVVISLILLFLYIYKFRSNVRRQSVVNQI